MNPEPLCLSVKEAAASVGVSVWTLRQWIAEGLIPTMRFPSTKYGGEPTRRILIAADDLRAFVARFRTGAGANR